MVSPAPLASEQSIPLDRDNQPAPGLSLRLLSLLPERLGLARCQSRFQRWKPIIQRRNESASQCRPFRHIGSRHGILGVFTVLTYATQLAVARSVVGRFRGQRANLKFRFPVGAGALALLVAIASSYVLENLLHLSSLVPGFAPSVVAAVVTAVPLPIVQTSVGNSQAAPYACKTPSNASIVTGDSSMSRLRT
jgi:hypothetical protein